MTAQISARQERPRGGEGRRSRRRRRSTRASSSARAERRGGVRRRSRTSDFQQDAAAALKINPRFSGAYRVPGDLAAANYRFEEAVALSRKALEIDPNDVRTLSALGVQLLRTGEEAEARTVLEKSFALDKFDQTTFNLLTMLDSLDKFEMITEGNIIVKLHRRARCR